MLEGALRERVASGPYLIFCIFFGDFTVIEISLLHQTHGTKKGSVFPGGNFRLQKGAGNAVIFFSGKRTVWDPTSARCRLSGRLFGLAAAGWQMELGRWKGGWGVYVIAHTDTRTLSTGLDEGMPL